MFAFQKVTVTRRVSSSPGQRVLLRFQLVGGPDQAQTHLDGVVDHAGHEHLDGPGLLGGHCRTAVAETTGNERRTSSHAHRNSFPEGPQSEE